MSIVVQDAVVPKEENMTRKNLWIGLVLLLMVVLLAGTTLAQAPKYQVTRWTTAAPGGAGTAQSYSLDGLVGQPDAGVLHNGKVTLSGGFWSGAAQQERIYLPIVQNR